MTPDCIQNNTIAQPRGTRFWAGYRVKRGGPDGDRAAGPQPHPINMRPPPHGPQATSAVICFLTKKHGWMGSGWAYLS